MEAVVRAGGYVVHWVTVADNLKTGDQLQLHLDQVNSWVQLTFKGAVH